MSRLRPLITVLLPAAAAVVVSGCAHFTPKPLPPAETATRLESRTLTSPALRSFIERQQGHPLEDWPPTQWDLTLLTLAAFYYHPTLDVARAAWAVTRAAIVTAGARPNPTLSVTPEYVSPPPASFGIGFDVPIETAGKRGHRIDEARELAESARWDVLTAAWQVHRDVRTAATDLAAMRRREQLLSVQLAVRETIVRLIEQRRAAGAVAANEVTVARAQAATTRLDLQTVRIERAEARVRLAEALGIPANALGDVALDVELGDTLPEPLPAQARAQALSTRTDILSALAQYAAAQSALQLEIARQYPDVHLGPGYQWDQGENKWALGVSLPLPMLNRNEGPIAEAEARREALAARFIALQAKVIGEIDRAMATLQAAAQARESGEALRRAQTAHLQSIESQLAAGAVDALEVAGARLDLAAAEQLAFEARVREQQALGALEDAAQHPLGSDDTLFRQVEATQQSPRSTP